MKCISTCTRRDRESTRVEKQNCKQIWVNQLKIIERFLKFPRTGGTQRMWKITFHFRLITWLFLGLQRPKTDFTMMTSSLCAFSAQLYQMNHKQEKIRFSLERLSYMDHKHNPAASAFYKLNVAFVCIFLLSLEGPLWKRYEKEMIKCRILNSSLRV